MRKITPFGRMTLNLGSLFLFAGALLSIALYMDDQNASWFNGVSTSVLWPIDMVLLALGVLGIIFMFRWGREPRPADAEAVHFKTLLNNNEIKSPPVEKTTLQAQVAEPAVMQATRPAIFQFEDYETTEPVGVDKHHEEFESDEP